MAIDGVDKIGNPRVWLWAEVDPANVPHEYMFWIVGTGHPIKFDTQEFPFIDTLFDNGYVWHVYGHKHYYPGEDKDNPL